MRSGFEWVIPPDKELIPNLEKYGKMALVAIQAVATKWGQENQDEARLEAPWTDRSGNAVSGIFFAVDGFGFEPITGTVTPELWQDVFIVEDNEGKKWQVNRGREDDVTIESGDKDTLIIALAHTVFYGKFLELSNGGRYAIIMSTIEQNLPRLERMLKDTFA